MSDTDSQEYRILNLTDYILQPLYVAGLQTHLLAVWREQISGRSRVLTGRYGGHENHMLAVCPKTFGLPLYGIFI